ncbi:hypothetical protein [Streptomyces sp. 3N207]|uniref:hypothetical protein n=1 Tax=Streptomyces sp. 3N207 TaxID=3457417 RepID=UPI003FD6481C
MSAWVVAAALVLLVGAGVAWERQQSPEPEWERRADKAIALTKRLDNGKEGVLTYAFLAGAVAERRGWENPEVKRYLGKVYGQRLDSGGYGLNYAWDAFSDGTVNPRTTTYTVSVSGHAGRVMLDGYREGRVPREEIVRLVDSLLKMPRVTGGPGVCLAYSDSRYDSRRCVPNVNASAGWFLARARAESVSRPGVDALIAAIAERDAHSYRPESGFWPYIEGDRKNQDWAHNALNAESELELSPAIGKQAVAKMMALSSPPRWIDPIGQVELLPHSCGNAPAMLRPFDGMLTHPRQTAQTAAQLAYWSARTASHC